MTAAEKLIFELVASQKLTPNDAAVLLEHQQKHEEPVKEKEIAIIGIAGKFPKGEDLGQFWECLQQQRNGIGDFPDARVRDCIGEGLPDAIEADQLFFKGGYLERIDQFDPAFFQLSPAEAKFMDPLQRLMLEASYQAIEDAGYYYKDLSGTNTGVYIGTDHTWGQWYRDNAAEQDPLLLSGTWSAILSSRISYGLNLKGPSLVIDTSCSSGLVAVHEACRAIQSGVCNLAIAGGIHINYSPVKNPMLDLVESQDYLIRTFDKQANGTVWGEGVGAVILKPLQQAIRDRDHIYGIIKGSAVNNDGASDGITAPSARAQEEVICQAWEEAGIDPQTITYVEAHGTGTQLGDSIEIDGLTKAFSRYTQKKQFCAIGTVKTNIGHTVGASGLASLLKVMLAFQHRKLPASLNFVAANPFIDFFASPVYVNDRLQDWTAAETPRVAGISSFGFSGTNCHMIVQEAPDIVKLSEAHDQAPLYLLPLSAKDDQVLLRLVEDYTRYISRHAGINLQDLCYTASTGRGHYNHRLVILFTGYADLLQKLEHLQKHSLASGQDVLSQSHEVAAHGGIAPDEPGPVRRLTKREKQSLTLEAARLLKTFALPQEGPASYRSIGELYVSGATIDWNLMYQGLPCRRLNLPAYPFHRIRCWAEKRGQGHPQHLHLPQAPGHPLLRGNVCETSGQVVYTATFSAAADWVLHEHQVGREYVLPGTAYIELLLEIGRRQGGRSVIKQLAFLQPFSLQEEEDTHDLQIVVSNGKEDSEFYIESKDRTDGTWRRHAEGKLCLPLQDRKPYDLPALLEAFHMYPKITGVETSGGYITTGARWNNIKELRAGAEECLVTVGLGDAFREEAVHYHYHPAMLDNAVNIAIRSIDDQLYLPFYYQEIRVYGRIPADIYSVVRRQDRGQGNQTATFDIDILNPAGEVLAEIEGYTIKQVQAQGPAGMYYEKDWIVQEGELSPDVDRETSRETVAVFTGEGDLADRLLEQIRAQYGQVMEISGRELQSREDYQRLWDRLKAENVETIIHLLSLTGREIATEAELHEAGERGFYSLYSLLDSLFVQPSSGDLKLVLVCDEANQVTGEEAVLRPHHGCLLGLGKVAREEFPQVHIRLVDVDGRTPPERIVNEFSRREAPYQVAYRNGQRYVERLREASLAPDEAHPGIQEGRVYVITGGTGGLGLEIGKQMSRMNRIKLHLIGRRELPARENWSEIVAAGAEAQHIRQITAVQEMERNGAEVQIHAADVAEEGQMRSLLERIRTRSGAIRGVVHAAGVAGEGLLVRKSAGQIREVLSAKVTGTWILDQLTKEDELDFFMMFSSMNTVTGGMGQSDYVAANSYLDLYADWMRKQGRKGITVNWPLWQEVGMAQAYEVDNRRSVFESLTPRQGAAIYAELLQCGRSRMIVGQLKRQLNRDTIGQSLMNDYVLSERLNKQLSKSLLNAQHPAGKPDRTEVVIKDANQLQMTRSHKEIVQILARVLDLQELSIFANFEDLGWNSLLAVRLHKELDAVFPGLFAISDVFSYPTVHDMAAFLERKRTVPHQREITIEQVMGDLENGIITAEEAEVLIKEISETVER
ncbi:type I polyketide synthase [Paenibacillus riograndensis]|uniref:Uncharacterized protein n=2 Tax=Paenibacillus riograndensis TaxID=483937 RepID=A0A0E3WGU9_9BACL|nr:type I polyketide synthase [Paenibacillus riograndensis]CQR54168.1 hypothetical protein PRIO_1758 [Paenibacillus riograndensis SBR5]